ncbi:MAG: HEAT repeat domain-containing protein [Anaerolineae bacterium]|nr:HEAT repeat domain-containing protein [Anaerolineae bacterium]
MIPDSNKNSDDLRVQLKQKSTDELIQLALTSRDDEGDAPSWDAIWALRYRATREVFEAAKTLCESHDPLKRMVGVDILAQLGLPTRSYLDETLDIFFNLIDTEQDNRVLNSVGVGLGHISPEPRKVKPLLKLKNHPDPEVRFGVASGLCCEEDPLAIQALIELSSDEDPDVRDWAAFALGTQIDVDTPQIRAALFKRVSDPDDDSDAPGEALLGLAKRHDERAFEVIVQHLEAGNAGILIFEAAISLADPRLYSSLVKLRDDPDYANSERDSLEDAIVACKNQV